jgi:hypothetical protein
VARNGDSVADREPATDVSRRFDLVDEHDGVILHRECAHVVGADEEPVDTDAIRERARGTPSGIPRRHPLRFGSGNGPAGPSECEREQPAASRPLPAPPD